MQALLQTEDPLDRANPVGCETCYIGFINWNIPTVFPISGIEKKKKKEFSQDTHLKRQADEREQDFSIRRKAGHSVVLLNCLKRESQ